jgi:lincosamide nucleotidyltransferase A/C/D/E
VKAPPNTRTQSDHFACEILAISAPSGAARSRRRRRKTLAAIAVCAVRRSAVKAEDVLELYTLLLEHGLQIWIDGGWGIDALVGRQTRPHKDLDAIVAFDDLPTLTTVLRRRSFVLKEIWSENRWLRHDGHVHLIGTGEPGGEVATAFVLKDALGREIDIHVLHIDEHGFPTPAWNCSVSFSPDALTGHGSIAGSPVHCLSAAMHMRTHTGYQLQDKDVQDLRRLHERFGIDYPEELAHLRANSPK